MQLDDLKKIVNSLPPEYGKFEVQTIEAFEAQGNGFTSVSVPVNSMAIDLHTGRVILVDPRQASIIQTLGNVPVRKV